MSAPAARAHKIEKLRELVLGEQLRSLRHLQKVRRGEHPDSSAPWKEVSGQTRVAILFAQGAMAAQRAETMAEAPKSFGVVLMPMRIENARDWEASRPSALEATAVPVLPAKADDNG